MASIAHVPFVVIGGGIVGLAVASRLSRHGPTVVLERRSRIIEEVSARNSGVVHAGIYYPDSLKADLCIRGAAIIWDLHRREMINASQCGKWIVATEDAEIAAVQKIAATMARRYIPHRWVSATEVRDKEPLLRSVATLESTATGIVDVDSLAQHYVRLIEANDGIVQLNCDVTAARAVGAAANESSYELSIREGGAAAEPSFLRCDAVVNCAGLRSPQVARLFSEADAKRSGSGRPHGLHHLWVGRYATVSRPPVSRLVYPCPLPHLQGLGTHATIDMQGSVRFGPDALYIDETDPDKVSLDPTAYGGEADFLAAMHKGVARFLPSVPLEALQVGYMGIRPKLSSPTDGFKDFVLTQGDSGSNVVHCFGIESPGLTSSAAIAEHVAAKLGLPRQEDWYVLPPQGR